MNATLLSHTPLQPAILACRTCYNSMGKSDNGGPADLALLQRVVKSGHHSVLEHLSYTFRIERISRVTSHQLVRHRIASYSQQSQRYVEMDSDTSFVIPQSICNNLEAVKLVGGELAGVRAIYKKLVDMGIPAEDARYILPNATESEIVMTMNARELLHFFGLRCCNRAQWEIRNMANSMLKLCRQVTPIVFDRAGAGCVRGACPEGAMSCGGGHD